MIFSDFRWFSHTPQFVNKFVDLDLPKNSDVYVLVSSLLPIRGHSWTPYTSRLGYSNFITNCVFVLFFITSNQGTIFQVRVFEFYYKLRWWAIFDDFHTLCNKFVDLDLPKNSDVYVLVSSLLPIRGHSWTPYTSRLGYSNFITNCVEFAFYRHDFPSTAIINFSNLNYPGTREVYILVHSQQLTEQDSLDIKE